MAGISCGPVAELVDHFQCGYKFRFSPCLTTEPKITQDSPGVEDVLLGQISEALSGLDGLHLVGCRGVTHEGLFDSLRHNQNGIKALSIEDISPWLVRHLASLST